MIQKLLSCTPYQQYAATFAQPSEDLLNESEVVSGQKTERRTYKVDKVPSADIAKRERKDSKSKKNEYNELAISSELPML